MGLAISMLVFLVSVAVSAGLFCLSLYGAYLGFKKKWYIGVIALVFSIVGIFIGGAKFFFNKNVLQ